MLLKEEAVAGACAGVIGTGLGFPLDTIKTRMQTSNISIFTAIRATYAEQGVLGFYRGIASPLLSLTILNTMNFSIYAVNCKTIGLTPNRSIHSHSDNHFEWRYGVAGACVGPFAAMISTPFELIKTKMQIGRSKGSITHNNSIRMAQSILQSSGLLGLYQGHLVNLTREVVFLSTYFITYENIKTFVLNLLPEGSSKSGVIAIPIAGGLSGALGWFISFPLDNIKSNIQTMSLAKSELFHRQSALAVGRELLQRRGIMGLYSGVLPSITRAFIVSASRFSAYEYVLSLFR